MGQANNIVKESVTMMAPKCRFCNTGPSAQSIKGKDVYGGDADQHFWQCGDCRMIYLYPPLGEKKEEEFYRREFEKYMVQRAGKDMDWSGPEGHFQSNQREVKRRMPFLEPFIKKGQRVLEIGCSSGFMLSALRDKGLEVYGLDPSGGFVEYVRAKGIKVFWGPQELKAETDLKFDLVIHYYVLEHIRRPVDFLNEYAQLLSKDGKMVFEVPCASDPLVELYRNAAFDKFYWSVAHHWYFNKESLARVLEKLDRPFQLYPEQRYDISNHMVWMSDGKPGGLGKYSHIFGEELDRLYKEQLKKYWLCDTIVAVLGNKNDADQSR